jgi:hypothetical protein
VEHNGSGTISFETDLDALTNGIDSALLAPSNLVRVHYGDLSAWPNGVAEGFITSAPPVKDDSGRWTVQVSGPGSWDALDFAELWPPAGAVGDTREFSYTAGMTGAAFVAEEWHKPAATSCVLVPVEAPLPARLAGEEGTLDLVVLAGEEQRQRDPAVLRQRSP